MNRPNLFDYAPSELSQDAVLIWLFRYADERFCEDEELHKTAQAFVRLFLGDYGKPIKTVEVWKQRESIDITVKVNNEIGLVVEDKAGAHLHGDQLQRYRESAEKWGRGEHLKMGFYYLNTGNPNTDDRENVKKANYIIINRRELLSVLNEYGGLNPILGDFRVRLCMIEKDTNSYTSLPFKQWSGCAWQGFYDWIHSIRNNSTWEWLNPPGGGFWGTWWNNREFIKGEFALYPQIDQGRFTFKMYCETDNNRVWGYRLRDVLEVIAQELSVNEVHRPGRMSFRGYATALLVVDPESYLGTGVVNLNAVEKRFEVYERMIEMCKARFRD